MEHTVTENRTPTGYVLNCTCGWEDVWNVFDGSAQYAAWSHKEYYKQGESK